MNGNKLQAALARRREIQQIKFEKSTANDKYFDKWGRITSRYEQWTAPTYYEQKNQDLKNEQQLKLKNATLDSRRKQLRELLLNEADQYKNELIQLKIGGGSTKRSTNQISNELLNGIHTAFKKQRSEEDKRRLQLESNLYRKWRNPTSSSSPLLPISKALTTSAINELESSILYNSKSDHQALAKMNWLDKQVAAQVERDKEQKEMEERQLRIQEETRKQMELSNQRKSIVDQEIKDLQLFVGKNLDELKEREIEMNKLYEIEMLIKKRKNEILTEYEQFQMVQQNREKQFIQSELYSIGSSNNNNNNNNNHIAFNNYNTRRIKLIYHEYSKLICLNLRLDIDLLKRIELFGNNNNNNHADDTQPLTSQQKTQSICEHFQRDLQEELEKQKQIECMYESEAKHNLIKQKELWMSEQMIRDKSIKNIFDECLKTIDNQLLNNIEQQNRLCDIKENHLTAIENTNRNIKRLLDPVEFTVDGRQTNNNNLSNLSIDNNNNYDSFTSAMKTMNIKNNSTNLSDCLKNNCNSNGQQEHKQSHQQPQSQHQQSPNRQENVMAIPKFGRKKIAWT